ncbi:MFS general substrate transporter [Polychaeton citri CBS 116435]|uniref:MFS general substrate transporter n=1 Tax=Polychaeton citri CBS 116435 TaxID=1314669 RepID=A0A9P4UN41_9PEZI|nr:MFS general substrate transporter [Polychaeton citri CBS 116435]
MAYILTAIFPMSLYRTIIATAIPRITKKFNSVDEIDWHSSAFTLCSTCFQLMWGKVYALYIPNSKICSAAPNSISFIIGRTVAGAGSDDILTGAIVLVAIAVPLPKRPLYNGFFSVVLGLSSVVGPLDRGAIMSNVSWRWCFYINLPIGGAAMLIIFILLKPTESQEPNLSLQQQRAKFDLLGELFLFPCLVCLLLALQWSGSTHAWNNWRVILVFVLFGACLIAFIMVQVFTQKAGTIESHLITNRNMVSTMRFMFNLSAFMQLFMYYSPLWFQDIKGRSAVQCGIDALPLVIALTLASIFSGQTTRCIGYHTPLAMRPSTLLGVGLGLGLQHGHMVAYTVLAPRDVLVGVSLVFFCQSLTSAVFVSIKQNVFSTQLIRRLLGAGTATNSQDIIQGVATNFRNISILVTHNKIPRLSIRQWKGVKDDDVPYPKQRERPANEEFS